MNDASLQCKASDSCTAPHLTAHLPQGVRRAHFLLRGVNPSSLTFTGGKMPSDPSKVAAEFMTPRMHFVLPPSELKAVPQDLARDSLPMDALSTQDSDLLSTSNWAVQAVEP